MKKKREEASRLLFPHLCWSFNSSSSTRTHSHMPWSWAHRPKWSLLGRLYSVFLEICFFMFALSSSGWLTQRSSSCSTPSPSLFSRQSGKERGVLLWVELWLFNTSSSSILPFLDSTPPQPTLRWAPQMHIQVSADHKWPSGLPFPLISPTSSSFTCHPQNSVSLKPATLPTARSTGSSESTIFPCVSFLLYPSRSKPLRMYPSIVSIMVQTPQDVSIYCVHRIQIPQDVSVYSTHLSSLPLAPGMLTHVVQGAHPKHLGCKEDQ